MIGLGLLVVAAAFLMVAIRTRASAPQMLNRAYWALGLVAIVYAVLAVVAFNGPTMLIGVVVLVALLLAAALTWATSRLPASRASDWARAHGLELTDVNTSFVTAYVTEGHRLRLVCGFGGAIALGCVSRGLGIGIPVSGWVWLMVSYLVGVVWSEAWLTRLPEGTHREASLAPRRVADYLAGRLRVAQVVVPLISLAGGAVAVVLGGHKSPDPTFRQLAAMDLGTLQWFAAGIGIGAVIFSLGIGWLQRRIVTKPQPTALPDLIAADDAVRASAVHLLSGTAVGIVAVCIGTQIQVLAELGIVGSALAGVGGMMCFLFALVAWRYYGHRAWVVPRGDRLPRTARGIEVARS